MLKVRLLKHKKMKRVKLFYNRSMGTTRGALLLIISCLLVLGSVMIPDAGANSISDQIEELQRKNAQNRAMVADLKRTATSYQNAIAQLQAEIDQLQVRINENLAEQASLQTRIEESQRELDRQKSILGADIKAMYVDGNISTIEMLATSKNLSDFVDKEAYRNAVQNKIQLTLRKIAALQAELKAQKARVEQLLAEQQAQQTSLSANRAEQSRMLTLNKQQQSDFNRQTSANQARIDDLIAQQRRANDGTVGGWYFIRFPGGIQDHDVSVDDYPYRDAGFSMQLGPCSHFDSYPDYPDRWYYCTRQCVSYAAWAVERSGRVAPKGYGSAKNWIYAAPASWVHRDPKPGDVGISTSGTWGHAVYVEAVEGNRIYVSEYNKSLTGHYGTRWFTFR